MMALLFLLLSLTAFTETTPPKQRVAVVLSSETPEYAIAIKELKKNLRASIQEFNLQKDKRNMKIVNSEADRVRQWDPDLIIAFGSFAYKIMKAKTKDVPVMYSMVICPQAYCEENETPFGVSLLADPEEEMRFVKELFGAKTRVGVIYNPKYFRDHVNLMVKTGKTMGLDVKAINTTEKGVYEAIDRIKDQMDVYFLIPDPVIAKGKPFERLRLECFRRTIPIIGCSRIWLQKDCAVALSADYKAIGRLTGIKAANFLKTGVRQGAIYEKKTEICLNEKMVEKLKLTLPKSIRDRAVIYRRENK